MNTEPGETPNSPSPREENRGIIDISDAGAVLAPNHNPRPQMDAGNRPVGNNNNRNRHNHNRNKNNRPQGQPFSSNGNAPVAEGQNSQPSAQNNRPNFHKKGQSNRSKPTGGAGAPGEGARPKARSRRMSQPRRAPMAPLTTAGENRVIHKANRNVLRIIPLGGSGEIGAMNMLVYEYNDDILVIDAGIKFPDADMPGVDYVIADTTYLEENKSRIRAFVVTHGHEDHIGAFPYVWPKFPVPIYTAPLTAGFIKAKFEEHGIQGYEFRIIQPGEKVQIGAFTIEPVQMTHSIPDILGLAITTPVGLIYHAADWKVDFTPAFGKPTDFAKLAELSNRGVLCMLTDSTGILQPGFTLSETVVSKAIEDVFIGVKGRLIVSSFSSRIDRMQHVINACAKTGRKLFLAGRSMERNANIAMELGYLKVPAGLIGDIRTVNSLPDDKVVVMSTGSQGEEGSALSRMSSGEHRHITIKKGDTVMLSSSIIPGNEKAIDLTINNLYRIGAEVITNKELDIHSSGHGSREEIKHVLNILKPKYLIPMHGDYRRFVEMGKLAVTTGIKEENVLIIENGQVVEFNLEGKGIISTEKVPVGSILIDGSGVGDVGEIVLRDRQTMAKDGVFLVILTVKAKSGQLISSPDIISRGFVYMKESEELIGGARILAKRIHAQNTAGGSVQWDQLKKDLREEMSDYLFNKTQRHPMVISAVIQI